MRNSRANPPRIPARRNAAVIIPAGYDASLPRLPARPPPNAREESREPSWRAERASASAIETVTVPHRAELNVISLNEMRPSI